MSVILQYYTYTPRVCVCVCIVITVSPVKYSYIIWPICNILYTEMDCLINYS